MTLKWSNWNRFIIFLVFVITVIVSITLLSINGVQARTILQESYNLNPNNICHVLSPDDTASYVAEKLTEMTGEAVSPLFSLTIIGGFKNFCTEEQYRDLLPWYYHTDFLIGSFILLTLLVFKDTFLTVLGPLKQPIDALAELVHVVSGIIALPIAVIYFADGVSSTIASGIINISNFIIPPAHAIDIDSATEISNFFIFGQTFGIALGLMIFTSIWVLGNVLEVFIFLSPIPFVDTCLSAIKTTIISVIILVSYFNPMLGAILALGILLISILVFNWSFRLFTFGIIFCCDFLRLLWRKFDIEKKGVLAFSGKNITAMKSGVLGRILPHDRNCVKFVYYPYLILPKQQKIISVDSRSSDDMAVTEGLISPTIIKTSQTDVSQKISTLFRLPPRYRTLESSIARYLEISFNSTIFAQQKKGFLNWFSNIFS